MATYEDSKYICILDEKHSIYALTNGTRRSIEKEFGFHLGLILLIKPSPLASPPSGSLFIGIYVTGLYPLWVTPTHSSTFIEVPDS